MSKMESYRESEASIDYRLKTSTDFYRPKLLQTFNGNQKPDTYLDWVNGEAGVPSGIGYVCLRVQISKGIAQREQHRLRRVDFLSHFLRYKKFSSLPFVMYIGIYLKVISRKYICKQNSRMSRFNMSSRDRESIFSQLRLQQVIPVREMSSFFPSQQNYVIMTL